MVAGGNQGEEENKQGHAEEETRWLMKAIQETSYQALNDLFVFPLRFF
jgi:hypothetical protein